MNQIPTLTSVALGNQRQSEVINMATKGIKKRDGSGRGARANAGRGGCNTPRKTGKK